MNANNNEVALLFTLSNSHLQSYSSKYQWNDPNKLIPFHPSCGICCPWYFLRCARRLPLRVTPLRAECRLWQSPKHSKRPKVFLKSLYPPKAQKLWGVLGSDIMLVEGWDWAQMRRILDLRRVQTLESVGLANSPSFIVLFAVSLETTEIGLKASIAATEEKCQVLLISPATRYC